MTKEEFKALKVGDQFDSMLTGSLRRWTVQIPFSKGVCLRASSQRRDDKGDLIYFGSMKFLLRYSTFCSKVSNHPETQEENINRCSEDRPA